MSRPVSSRYADVPLFRKAFKPDFSHIDILLPCFSVPSQVEHGTSAVDYPSLLLCSRPRRAATAPECSCRRTALLATPCREARTLRACPVRVCRHPGRMLPSAAHPSDRTRRTARGPSRLRRAMWRRSSSSSWCAPSIHEWRAHEQPLDRSVHHGLCALESVVKVCDSLSGRWTVSLRCTCQRDRLLAAC